MSLPSRRDFVRLCALSLGSAFLAACAATGLPVQGATAPAFVPATVMNTPEKPEGQGSAGQKTRVPKGTSTPSPTGPDRALTEILGRPTDASVTANVMAAAATAIYYEYGTVAGAYGARTSPQVAAPGVPLETIIGGLQPDTRYYYRLRYDGGVGPERTFVTQRRPGSAFSFAIQGDSHPERAGKEFDPELYALTLQHAAADRPDFYMTMGDDFSVDTLKTVNADTVRALYNNQRQWLSQVGAPVFLVNGNHEQAAMANLNGTAGNVAVWAQTARNACFPQPAPDGFYTGDTDLVPFIGQLRDYYAFHWGDALFVVLDQYWHSPATVDNQFGADRVQKAKRDLWQVTIGDAQYRWLKHTLATSTAKWKFVFSHHVLGTQRGGTDVAGLYEWGDAAHLAAHRPGWDRTIHQLLADNHVTIYFQGHDHIFVRQELDGVIYQSLPEPADPHYALNNAASYKSGDKLPSSGYVRVNVSPAGVKVDYVRTYQPQDEKDGCTSGEVAFSYTV